MKTFTIDVERFDCLDTRGGIQFSFDITGSVLERKGVDSEWHVLNMSNATARNLHKYLEKHFGKDKQEVMPPPSGSGE